TKSQTPPTRAQITLNPTPPREARTSLGGVSRIISSVVSEVNEYYSCILYVPQHIRLSSQDFSLTLRSNHLMEIDGRYKSTKSSAC
ncbi:hypothetical protein, partial [uncultured Muribaculum sp.]|uniref:hypothetical protein n=1 Tax=uncultured Muribaculum sp. TaxID=1918613 RepID=UPI002730CB0F